MSNEIRYYHYHFDYRLSLITFANVKKRFSDLNAAIFDQTLKGKVSSFKIFIPPTFFHFTPSHKAENYLLQPIRSQIANIYEHLTFCSEREEDFFESNYKIKKNCFRRFSSEKKFSRCKRHIYRDLVFKFSMKLANLLRFYRRKNHRQSPSWLKTSRRHFMPIDACSRDRATKCDDANSPKEFPTHIWVFLNIDTKNNSIITQWTIYLTMGGVVGFIGGVNGMRSMGVWSTSRWELEKGFRVKW